MARKKTQRKAFIDVARKAECNESETAWEVKLRRIAKAATKPIIKGKKSPNK